MSTIIPFPRDNSSELSREECDAFQQLLRARAQIENILNQLTAIYDELAAPAAQRVMASS